MQGKASQIRGEMRATTCTWSKIAHNLVLLLFEIENNLLSTKTGAADEQ